MEEGEFEERRGRSRGRPRGRQRGRPRIHHRNLRSKPNKIESDEEEPEEKRPVEPETVAPECKFDKDCDISSLEAPTFTTLDRGPPAPMLRLSWNHPVNLIGEKVLSPRIHTCDTCDKPILIYGRMIPCKHVFCLWCAKGEDRVCARCGDRVARVEQTGLGTVFMCTFSNNDALCKRTYLSQRDLQAHVDHRHMKVAGNSTKDDTKDDRVSHRDPRGESRLEVRPAPRPDPRPAATNDPRVGANKENFESRELSFSTAQLPRTFNPSQPPPPAGNPLHPTLTGPATVVSHAGVSHHIPVMTSSRTNLITVPIQDPPEQPTYLPPTHPPPPSHVAHPPPPSQHNPLSHPPPPPSHPFTTPPPISHVQPPPYSPSVTSAYSSTYPSSQPTTQYTFPPTSVPPQAQIIPPPYSSTLPPVPVPPPQATFRTNPRPPYEGQYAANQWSSPPLQGPPPPNHPLSHPPPGPPRHHPHANAQSGNYYR